MNSYWERGGNPSFGWPHPDSMSRCSATQHTGLVSRPVDVHPSTSWDLPFQQQGCTGFQPYEGPTPTSWDHPTTRVEEFHVPCSYWEPTAPRGTSTQVTSSVPLSPPSSASSPYEFDPILGRQRTSWDLPRPRIAPESCSNPSDWDYSDSYAYDSPFRRPLTSWDLPSPRFESYGGGGSSQYEYGASGNHGGGSYSPYSNYGGGYSGGRYVNEPNPYVSPPPPPREGNYVLAPQPKPPCNLPEWRLPMWDLSSHQATTPAAPILAPSLPAVQHQFQPLPASGATQPSREGCYVPPPPSYTPPPQSRGSSCFLTTPNDARDTTAAGREGERDVSGMVEEESLMVDDGVVAPVSDEPVGSEEGDALNPEMDEVGEEKCDFVANDSEVGVKLSNDSNGSLDSKVAEEEADVNNVVQSSAANINDDEFEKTLEFTDALMVYDSKVAKEHYSRTQEIEVDKTGELAPACESEFVFAHYKFGWALLYQAQGEAEPFHFTPNKKGEGPWKKRLKSREVSRRSTIFGIYALEEVYKDF